MNKSKKGVLIAGGILAIISAIIGILASQVLGGATLEDVRRVVLQEYSELSEQQIEDLINLTYQLAQAASKWLLIISVIRAVFGLIILVKAINESISKGLVITELVLSILTSATITMILMIIALCLRDDEPTKTSPSNIETIEI